jgi:DNA-binding beta-propeller fold protein YncE
VLKYDAGKGYFQYKWKWADLTDADPELKIPQGVAVNTATGELFLVDTGVHKVRVFDMNGAFLHEWGGWGDDRECMKLPQRIAVDEEGYVYVTDYGHYAVKKFNSQGVFIGSWGTFGSDPGQFSGKCSIAVSPVDNGVYVGDWGNHRVQKFSHLSGEHLLSFGHEGTGEGEFGDTTELAFHPVTGNLLVADTENHRIQVFDSDGNFLLQWGGYGSGEGSFYRPMGLVIDSEGLVFVADQNNHRLQVFDSQGNFIREFVNTVHQDEELADTSGVGVDQSSGFVYVVEQSRQKVRKYDGDGYLLTMWGSKGVGDGQFQVPTGVTVDNDGNVLVVDESLDRVQKFDAHGNWLETFGENGSGDGQFDSPTDVAVDPATGHIYVSERYNHRIQKFDGSWNFILKFGMGPAMGDGQLNQPFGVSVHPTNGNVYVADSMNRLIQVFDADGNFIRKWGEATGDNPGAFSWPRNTALDSAGNVYVADTDHNRFQKFDAEGNFIYMVESQPKGELEFHPRAVAVDRNTDEVYVTASYQSQMFKFQADGKYLLRFGYYTENAPGEIRSPLSGVYDPLRDRIVISDMYKSKIQCFDNSGNLLAIDLVEGAVEDVGHPEGIAIDSNGRFYISSGGQEDPNDLDVGRRYIKVYDQDGSFLFRFGSYEPSQRIKGIVVHEEGGQEYVYAAVRGLCRVKKFDTNGNLVMQFGESGIGDGQFTKPWGIAVEPSTGNIFVSDSSNNNIQKFDPAGNFLMKCGGSGSQPGQFNEPRGLEFGPDGNLYVCDFYNHRIQVFDPAKISYLFEIIYLVSTPSDIIFDSEGDIYVLNYYEKRIKRYTWGDLPVVCSGDYDCDDISDTSETYDHETDPYNADTDADGLNDGTEILVYGTDPVVTDTDLDGMDDGEELDYWGSDWDADHDGDGLINLLDWDSDNDSYTDGDEVDAGSNPQDNESIPSTVTVYEDAEDGFTIGWYVYDDEPVGGQITNVYDEERSSRVISLEGDRRKNGYHLKDENLIKWHNTGQFVIEWSMKYSELFIIYIDVETTAGKRSIVYVPRDYSNLGESVYIYHGIGSISTDGQWRTIYRDLRADIFEAQPSVELLEVNGFLIRGSGRVDDIKLHNQKVN